MKTQPTFNTLNTLLSAIALLLLTSCSPSLEYVGKSNILSSTIDSLFIYPETHADGSGEKITDDLVITSLSDSYDIFAISRDENGNFISNKTVLWSQEGTSGNLLMLDGGKSAQFIPTENGTTTITLYTDEISKSVTFNVAIPEEPEAPEVNDIPSFSFVTPSVSTNSAYEQTSFDITWTDSDSDNDANIDLYYHTSTGGNCSVGTLITSSISEDDATDSYTFNLSATAPGTYYICAHISDDDENIYEWSSQQLTVLANISPSISFSSPTSAQEIIAGTNLSINWDDVDPEDDNSVEIFLTTASSGACSGTSIHTTTNNNSTDTFSLDTASLDSDRYYLCATLDDGINPVVHTYSPSFYIGRVCSWIGTDSDMLKPSNWADCNSVSPTSNDYMLFPGPGFSPVVTADMSVRGIYSGGSPEIIMISSGSKLQFTRNGQFLSNITFEAATSNCADCEVFLEQDAYVLNGSTLRLESGVTLKSARASLSIGDGTTHGHLVIDGGMNKNEWVKIRNDAPWGFRSINVQGTSSNNSTISVNGLDKQSYNGHNSQQNDGFNFINYYEILQIDNIDLTSSFFLSASNEFTFQNCSNGIFTDSDFSNIHFANHYTMTNTVSKNIVMNSSTCTSLPGAINITMTNASGFGFGSLYEDDPNNLVTWYNETQHECVWTGASNTDWDDSLNWNNCANSRNGYPDQFDSAVIPSTAPRFPSLDRVFVVNEISNSSTSGGGTITIEENAALWNVSGYIKEDLIVQAYNDSCTTCTFGGEEGFITNGARLTIGNAIGIRSNSSQKFFNIGNSTSSGHLSIDTGTDDKSKWAYTLPNSYYAGGFRIEGPNTSERSTVDISGLKIDMIHATTQFEFIDNYRIMEFDNISFESAFTWDMQGTRVLFNNCSNSVFSDTEFDGLGFNTPAQDPFTTNYNISFGGCSSYPASIEVYPILGDSNEGYGDAYSNDVGGVLNWN